MKIINKALRNESAKSVGHLFNVTEKSRLSDQFPHEEPAPQASWQRLHSPRPALIGAQNSMTLYYAKDTFVVVGHPRK